MFGKYSNEEYALKVPIPVYFSKRLQGGGDGTTATE
jgi:hypothetical protein